MNNFFRKLFKRIIIVVVCMAVMISVPMHSYALTFGDITSDAIKDKEDKINAAEEEKKALEDSLKELENKKAQLEKEKKNLSNYGKELDLQLAEIEVQIAELTVQITQKEAEIAQTEKELQAAIETENAQYEAMKRRIQFMYEQGEENYLALLFSAENFSDMLNKADYIEQLSAYDRQKLDEYVAITEFVRLCKSELELQKMVLDKQKEGVVIRQNEIETLIANKKVQIEEYQSNIATQQAAIDEYEEDLKFQNELISQLEAEVLAAKKEILLENGIAVSYNGEKMTWPCPSYTRISSEYGWRIHPTLGVNKYHNGVDMAAPKGSDILAAFSGEVVAATYNSTMGNYVLMNHGNGYYTIYMHASKLCVTPGEIIIEGEKIAEVGSTGRSTGPHLHFGVRKNGEYVNPMSYLK